MSLKVELIIPGSCKPKQRPITTFKSGRAITFTPTGTRDYEKKARVIVLNAMNELKAEPIPYPKPVRIIIEFILKKKPKDLRPDLFNLAMAIGDLLQESKKYKALAFTDDSQIVEAHLYKGYGEYPMTKVIIEEI